MKKRSRLRQPVHVLGQPGLVAVGILLVDDTVSGRLVDNGSGRFKPFGSFFLCRLQSYLFHCGSKAGTEGPVPETFILRLLHPLGAGLMDRQGNPFNID